MQMASIIVCRSLGLVGAAITASVVHLESASRFGGRSSNALRYSGGAAYVGKGGTLRKDSESVVQEGSRREYDRRLSSEPLPKGSRELKSIEEQELRTGRMWHCCPGASGLTSILILKSEVALRGHQRVYYSSEIMDGGEMA